MGLGPNANPDYITDAFRGFLTIFDRVAAILLSLVYRVFYMVANATILSGDVIKVFYSRIQLVLGIFMIFKLSMTVLNIIINPDSIKDQKQGPSKIVVRVVVSLFLLTLIIPMNIPNAEEKSLNYYINNHGVLFGFLYKAQETIMSENILAKLIIGAPNNGDEGMDINSLSDVGKSMAGTVLKVFIRINVKDEDKPPCDPNTEDENGLQCGNVVCPEEVNASGYAEENVSPDTILSHINDDCGMTGPLGANNRYAFTYVPIISAFVMIVMFLIILGFTLDIAVRAIKLMVLRLIAPIPIISYVDPKSDQKGAFGNWVKTLTSTYLDLFIRLAIVYFGLFIIQSVINGGLDIFGTSIQNNYVLDVGLAMVFIILGILVFMRQAPKFIRDMLGLQGPPMSNVGLSSVLGGTAAFLGGAGLAGAGAAAISNFEAGSEAVAQGKATGLGWGAGRDLAAQIRTGDQKSRGGFVNNARDRLMRNAGVNMARRYGVTGEGLEVAKDNMYAAQSQAAKSKDLYDRFLKGNATNQELAEIAALNGIGYDSRTGTFDTDADKEKMRKALYTYQSDDAKAAAKAESLYKEGKAFGDSHRVTPSFEEEHRRSYREMVGRGNPRPDMYNARGRGATSHQRVMDRVFGTTDNWRQAEGPNNQRTDNRWDPNGNKNVENNSIHDNPWGPGGPGSGGPGGPPPGGPPPGGPGPRP